MADVAMHEGEVQQQELLMWMTDVAVDGKLRQLFRKQPRKVSKRNVVK